MLSLRSEVFQAMFSIDSQEKQENMIKISDISSQTMKSFLKFIYTDLVELKEITCDLMKAADKYNFPRLISTVQLFCTPEGVMSNFTYITDVCLKHLLKIISTENVMDILVTAYLLNPHLLLKEVSKFIFNHRGSILKCDQWDEIKMEHPGIATKVIDLIVFRDAEKATTP